MQCKHILLISKAKHLSTSQVKTCSYIKAKSCPRWMTQYMTGNFICTGRLTGLCDMSRHDSVLEKKDIRRLWSEVLSGLLRDVYTMRSSQRSVATATVAAAVVMWQQYRPVSHELNMAWCNCPCDCHTGYTDWNQSHPLAKWHDTWNAEETLKLVEIVKQLRCSLPNGPQRIRKERILGRLTLVCIGCTSVVQCEQTVVLWSAEMRNFSAAECGKVIMGNLRNVPHLIFCKLPLDNFPHSAKYSRPSQLPPRCQNIGLDLTPRPRNIVLGLNVLA